ncbi:hypothetical protein C8F04DRAFT_917901, partial [Mycena alexandri]
RPLCTVCNHRYAIYTCPRCTTRTCSLPCSTTHKARAACSGERDKAAYVPMNRYGWGTMMDDYSFLEDVGRKVGEWGGEIAKGKFSTGAAAQGRGQGRGRGRGRGRGGGGHGQGGRTKRDVLRIQLEARDIEMDILPAGMERHKINQSSWDSKNQTALLTIEFKFHPPPNPLALPSQAPDPLRTLLTHRNSLDAPKSLLQVLQHHINERKEGVIPVWVRALACPDLTDPEAFAPPHCVMAATVDPLVSARKSKQQRAQTPYYRLDPAQPLSALLRGKHFVEFPTIEVWEEFCGTVVDGAGAVMQQDGLDGNGEEGRAPKRRKLDRKAGGKAIAGLLGGYGSSSEDEDEDGKGKEKARNGLEMLGGYSGSEDEAEDGAAQADISMNDSDDDGVELDPAKLVELMREARGDASWTPHMHAQEVEDDDLVDWGDSDTEG